MEIIARMAEKKSITIETNGTLITPQAAIELVRLAVKYRYRGGIAAVNFSIHGTEKIHCELTGSPSSYELALSGMDYIAQEKKRVNSSLPRITVKAVVSQHNAAVLPLMAKEATRAGAELFVLKLLDPASLGMEIRQKNTPLIKQRRLQLPQSAIIQLTDSLARLVTSATIPLVTIPLGLTIGDFISHYSGEFEAKRFYCTAPWSNISVFPNGDLYICKLFGGGNIFSRSVLWHWESPPYRAFRKELLHKGLPKECMGCCFLIKSS